MREDTTDAPEFTDEQLRAALRRIGRDVRREAFAAGRPIFIVRNGLLLAVHSDGTEEVIEAVDQGAAAGAKE